MLVFQRQNETQPADLFTVGSSNYLERRNGPLSNRASWAADGLEGRKMLITLMLVCAVLASLAFGVLTAYAICLGFFRMMAGRTSIVVQAGTPAKAEV